MDMGKTWGNGIDRQKYNNWRSNGWYIEMKGVHSANFNNDDIDRLLESFKGIIEQIPPMYSSVKVEW